MDRVLRTVRAERGSFLVEALVTALVLGIAAVGLFEALSAAQASSSRNRLRAQAADVAQTALDRLRMRPYDQLRAFQTTPNVWQPPGTRFTVTSRTRQPSRVDTPTGCATQQARDYLEVNVTVTWPNMNGVRPVRMDSEIAAPVAAAGDVVLKVTDRDGLPVRDVSATLSGGPRGGTAPTDAAGCARWNQLDASVDYTLGFAHTLGGRWITPDRVHAYTQRLDIAGEQTRTVGVELDKAGTVPVRFRWKNRDAAAPYSYNGAGANPRFVSFGHSRLTTPLALPWTPPAGTASGDVPDLYPFADGYSVYGGSCAAAKPPTAPVITVPRGARLATVVDVDLYVIDAQVQNGTNADGSIRRPPTDTLLKVVSECGTTWDGIPVTTDYGSYRTIDNRAFPYGTGYTVCAYSRSTGRWDIERGTVKAINVGSGSGDVFTLNLAANQGTTPCV